eukprot:CAMPEP_0184644750 /NCGR_PEP_ID=MMETSP0308-20130426/1409_1 /TAXON_ID=38269 /ORGANISM="Gloeochaete witrockiana, Strain SAG 46.84" /LENGTH=575 /DNA_ID=CAMNT_0027073443 /DNA_START=147 /DNA_END=1874 /DNA_ORIENTATION=-
MGVFGKTPTTLSCGHTYCVNCIKDKAECLICHTAIPPGAKFEPNSALEEALKSLSLRNSSDVPFVEIPFRDMTVIDELGTGSFGRVTLCIWNGTYVACKTLVNQKMADDAVEDFKKEIIIMNTLRHPNVVLFIGASTTSPMCLVTEYLPGTSLWHYLRADGPFKGKRTANRPPDRQTALSISLDTARGLIYLHSRGILHRDVKSHNILLDENLKAKVSDFGLSRVRREASSLTIGIGSPLWMAPEVWEEKPYDGKADVYSFAVVMWELMTGLVPFSNLRPFRIGQAVTAGERPPLPADSEADPLLNRWSRLIRKCWDGDPQRRPDFSQVITELMEMTGFQMPGSLQAMGNSPSPSQVVPLDISAAPRPHTPQDSPSAHGALSPAIASVRDANGVQVPPEIRVVKSLMEKNMEESARRVVLAALEQRFRNVSDLARHIRSGMVKSYADETWHCIVGKSFASSVSFKKGCYISMELTSEGSKCTLWVCSSTSPVENSNVQVNFTDTAKRLVEKAVEQVGGRENGKLAGFIQNELDRICKASWQCVVGEAPFGSSVIHQVGLYASINREGKLYLLWAS